MAVPQAAWLVGYTVDWWAASMALHGAGTLVAVMAVWSDDLLAIGMVGMKDGKMDSKMAALTVLSWD